MHTIGTVFLLCKSGYNSYIMTKRDLKKPVIVFYHERCSDGFGAAWAAWKKFGARAAYVPITHNEGIPEDLRGKEIYFVDIVYPKKDGAPYGAESARYGA